MKSKTFCERYLWLAPLKLKSWGQHPTCRPCVNLNPLNSLTCQQGVTQSTLLLPGVHLNLHAPGISHRPWHSITDWISRGSNAYLTHGFAWLPPWPQIAYMQYGLWRTPKRFWYLPTWNRQTRDKQTLECLRNLISSWVQYEQTEAMNFNPRRSDLFAYLITVPVRWVAMPAPVHPEWMPNWALIGFDVQSPQQTEGSSEGWILDLQRMVKTFGSTCNMLCLHLNTHHMWDIIVVGHRIG